MKYNLLDEFAGIGGFHLGLKQAGFEFDRVCFSEIDKHAISVYEKNFKEAEYVGGIESVHGGTIRRNKDEKWIVTFGSPCQDLSLAGKRKGMGGSRSSLFFEATRTIRELKPDYFIWENVKGAFSSNGGLDFVAVLREIASIGGYGCQWELCNTRWFLPQNRERIYLVGCLGGIRGREIFPIGEDVGLSSEAHTGRGNDMLPCITATEYKGPSKQRPQNLTVGTWRTHKDGEGFREVSEPICPTIPARAREDGSGQPVIIQRPHGFNRGGEKKLPSLRGSSMEHNDFLKQKTDIRRLTPTECERLQGFPDGWTEGLSDTQRYKTLGNAVSVPVVKAIGERIRRIVI